ncbi:MAG: rod shape-determining protein MreC [Prevotellaceae bacterium]|jgi:rod shape-determining protein MreC|nr:rod shape-determining protein MreC [Prevotellaceae bacterium]
MRKLIQFLVNNVFYIIFLILEIISFALLVNFNNFQKSVYLTSANGLVGRLNALTTTTTEYFGLYGKNEDLALANADLLNEVYALRQELSKYREGDSVKAAPTDTLYRFLPAKVINNSTDHLRNYITLDKGTKDGVHTDMGVVSDAGIVGIVCAVSDHFAVAISVLNPKIKYSAKFKRDNNVGSVVWDGADYRYMKMIDISEHVPLAVGDTVVTTGFSSYFPENMPIGVVKAFYKRTDNTYYDIDVELFTDFKTLSYVKVVDYHHKNERENLEESMK